MSVDRNISIRLLTNLDSFSDIVNVLIYEGFSFGENGTIVSLLEDDIDGFNYTKFNSFDIVKDILNRREAKGYCNYIIIWDKNIDDSLLVSSRKLDTQYNGYKNHYEINLGIGYGVRIKGADRYTDFGIYLNKLIPILVKNSMFVCEVNCSDFDC